MDDDRARTWVDCAPLRDLPDGSLSKEEVGIILDALAEARAHAERWEAIAKEARIALEHIWAITEDCTEAGTDEEQVDVIADVARRAISASRWGAEWVKEER